MAAKVPTEEEVIGYMDSLSNWGRWGPEDQMGTLNLITPEKRKQAAQLVQDGVSISCSRPITTEIAPDVAHQVLRYMINSGEGVSADPPEGTAQRPYTAEFIGMVFHSQNITHIDSLAHFSWRGMMYNGRPANLVTSMEGAQVHSIDVAHQGIATKAVLLDIARVKGKEWLGPGERVMPEDLEAAEEACGVRVESGDVLLVRTGYYRRRLEKGPSNAVIDGCPGCHVACVPWFHQRGISMLGSDTGNDIQPDTNTRIRSPLHVVSLVAMGLWIIDNCNLEELAMACKERNRWDFMLNIGPLRLQNVTGSPVNPIAIF